VNLVEWGISIAVMPRIVGSTVSLFGSGRRSRRATRGAFGNFQNNA